MKPTTELPASKPTKFGHNVKSKIDYGCWFSRSSKNRQQRQRVSISDVEVKLNEWDAKPNMIRLSLDPTECPSKKVRQVVFVDMIHYNVKTKGNYLKFEP